MMQVGSVEMGMLSHERMVLVVEGARGEEGGEEREQPVSIRYLSVRFRKAQGEHAVGEKLATQEGDAGSEGLRCGIT